MEFHSRMIYCLGVIMLSFLVLIYFLLRNIYLRAKAEKELRGKNEETTALYEELVATDDELRQNMHQLMEKQEQLQKSEQRYRVVMESTMDIIWEGDLINRKRIISENVYDILGYKSSELEPMQAWFDIIHPDDKKQVEKFIREQIADKVEFKSFEYRVRAKDGNYKWLLSNTKCEFDSNGAGVAVFGAFADITELKEEQQKVNNLAYYDSITGLPNRTMLRQRVEEEIVNSGGKEGKFAIIFLDLDNFKFVNDSYGHTVGDKLLSEVGSRLKEIQNKNILSFRLGGDEFIIFIKGNPGKEVLEEYSKELYRSLAVPICIAGNMFNVTHSSGIVFYPDNGMSFDELLKNADTAMYKSKESGRNTHTFYDNTLGDIALEKIKIQGDLHRALENNEFILHYQPIIDVEKGKIIGCEALIRWRHPEKGLIYPEKFIGVAEESGMIIDIGKWVMIKACNYAKAINDNGFKNFSVSVNVSTYQLLQRDFTEFVLKTLKDSGLAPEHLCLEITESVLMKSMDLVIEKLRKLKEHNVRIALDDFGCGYCSLTYLRMLPINTVKIDKSFIMDIKSKDDDQSIARTIVLLAKQMGLSVIGEGVETNDQLEYLKKHVCDMFQGYLVSKPVPEEDMNKLINGMCPKSENIAG